MDKIRSTAVVEGALWAPLLRKREGSKLQKEAPDILRVIVEVKRHEVERLKAESPVEQLEERISAQTPPLDFGAALRGDSVRVIAEVKKASPAKGLLRPDFDAAGLAATYVDNGAAAIAALSLAVYDYYNPA